jgi:3-dehydroquinate synthase
VPTVRVDLGARSYDITIGAGVLAQLPDVLHAVCPAAHYALIADATVAGLHGERVRKQVERAGPCTLLRFPAGERNKSRAQWEALADAMGDAGIGRDGAVIALGGGVTGDLAGFVAATYRRGIPMVQLPTSVLAMVDSSIGGKTGLDTRHGKNLVGAFHQPAAVLADVSLLRTLPDPHVRAGLAEALKHGAITDRGHFERISALRDRLLAVDDNALVEIIAGSVAIKAAVVAQDERERGRRAILNFGHTVAHALEATSGLTLLHGEAVAIGMVVEARLGERLGITAAGTLTELQAGLRALGLPTGRGNVSAERILAAMSADKKVRGGTVKFAFLKELGQAARSEDGEWTFPAPGEAVVAALSG